MDNKYGIQVLNRTFRIMDVLLEAREPLSLELLVERSGLPKSTVFRIVSNLLHYGYLCETDGGYWLGLKLISFGTAVENRLAVQGIAAPYLDLLRDKINETVYLATLTEDWSVIYLDQRIAKQPVAVNLHSVGMIIEMYCTALGKVLAAYHPPRDVNRWLETHELLPRTPNTIVDKESFVTELAAIRERGYSVDNAERDLSISCIAAPIHNAHGEVIAAISVAGPIDRMPRPLIGSEVAHCVLETAQQISEAMGMQTLSPIRVASKVVDW